MATIESCLEKLTAETDRKITLKQLKIVLASLKPSELDGICENLNISPLFDCLNSDSDQIGVACSILNNLLTPLSASLIIRRYESELIRGLNHPDTRVKQLVLQQISRCTSKEAVALLIHNPDLIITIIQLLPCDDVHTVKHAQQVIVYLASFEDGLTTLLRPNILGRLQEVMAISDIVRYRGYDVVVGMCKQSEAALQKCVDAKLLEQLISETGSSDPLIQLNCLEVLSEMAMVPHCLQYLEDSETLKMLEKMILQSEDSVLAGFLLPGLIKFFGHVGHLHPKRVCTTYRPFINKVFDSANSDVQGLRNVAIQTVGVLGASVDGKLALSNLGEPMIECMRSIGVALGSAPSDIRIKALNAVESLLSVEKDSEVTIEVTELLKTWFDLLARQPLTLLKNIAQQPFTDLRCASMSVLAAVARQPWGQRYMNDSAGFVEYLLDRSTETDKDGKEMKFDIIKTLAESPTARDTLGNVLVLRMKDYVYDGPFHIQAEANVAVESAT